MNTGDMTRDNLFSSYEKMSQTFALNIYIKCICAITLSPIGFEHNMRKSADDLFPLALKEIRELYRLVGPFFHG